MRFALTWLRLDVRRHRLSLIVLALLVAFAAATVLTAVAGARRGQTAFGRLWARTLPATATVVPNQPGFDWAKVRALPEVSALSTFPVGFGFVVEGARGASAGVQADSEFTRTIERPVVLAGRPFSASRADEVLVTPKFAASFGKGVGDRLTLHLASPQQINDGYDGSTGPPRGPEVRVRIVGVIRSPWGSVPVDGPGQKGGVLTSAAFFSHYRASIMGTRGQTYINALVRLKGGAAAVPAFRADLARLTGRSDIDVWNNLALFGDPARRLTEYEAACVLAFALTALVASFFLIGQPVARLASSTVADLQVLRAAGMTRRQAVASASAGPFLAAIAGTMAGVAGAIVASRWMPVGAASIVEPHPGLQVDWLVLGMGFVIAPLLVLAGSAAAAAAALTSGRRHEPQRRSAVASAAAGAGFPASVVVGARFAFERGRGRSAVPVRQALVGAVTGVLGVLAAFTFYAGVSDAAAKPARFGQTWQLSAFLGFNGLDFGPASRVLQAVTADRDVIGVQFATVTLRPGANVRAAARRLNAAAAINGGGAFTFAPPPAQPEVQQIKELEVLPLALAAFLAVLAFAAVGHTLSIAVTRRRHELAVLRAVGMTGLQTRMVVATQASLLAVVGLVFGMPAGLALGRGIWRVVAGFTPVAYHPPLAGWALLLIGPIALLAANALAALPGHRAARLCAGQVLRAE